MSNPAQGQKSRYPVSDSSQGENMFNLTTQNTIRSDVLQPYMIVYNQDST